MGVVNVISHKWFDVTSWSTWSETVLWGVFKGILAGNDMTGRVSTFCSSKVGRCDLDEANVPRMVPATLEEDADALWRIKSELTYRWMDSFPHLYQLLYIRLISALKKWRLALPQVSMWH